MAQDAINRSSFVHTLELDTALFGDEFRSSRSYDHGLVVDFLQLDREIGSDVGCKAKQGVFRAWCVFFLFLRQNRAAKGLPNYFHCLPIALPIAGRTKEFIAFGEKFERTTLAIDKSENGLCISLRYSRV